jgi:hypothetical protein
MECRKLTSVGNDTAQNRDLRRFESILIKKFARNPFFPAILAGFHLEGHRRHACKQSIGTIMEISDSECLRSKLVNSDVSHWDLPSVWRDLPPRA